MIDRYKKLLRSSEANGSTQTSRIAIGALGALALIYSGCAMCCGPYDYDYPTFGGVVQRADPVWGRVGSIFSDPGPFGGPAADHNLTPRDSAAQDAGESLENINGGDTDLEPPENVDEDNPPAAGDVDVLPPPSDQRPSPDDDTRALRRLRKQSQMRDRGQRWR